MQIEGWKYYNHAMIPTTAPHEEVNISPIKDGSIWKTEEGKKALLARWTEDFDCGYETEWWYVIKEGPFNIESLKSKRRYEIKKGLSNFEIREINLGEFLFRIADIYEIADYSYGVKMNFDKKKYIESNATQPTDIRYWGAFSKESNELCAFSFLRYDGKYADYVEHKAIPSYEKYGVNAALVAGVLEANKDFLSEGGYICDGARSIYHDTAFQEYLEKYFEFRKAYCNLRVEYSMWMRLFIKMLYPFRKLLRRSKSNGLIHAANGVLLMEEIVRKQR